MNHVLECISADVFFRPRRHPKPRIYGTQTAFVVGKQLSKDEIDVDKFGRVKVHFTWDRRDTSFEGKPTRFIRVSHGWAGQGFGRLVSAKAFREARDSAARFKVNVIFPMRSPSSRKAALSWSSRTCS